MNSINEKEKKLNLALEELKNLDLTNPDLKNNIQNLNFITSPYLSILDLLMNNSINSIESILRNPIIER